uniref:Uncharacterized protein n=1 Tax=Rhizophora mucronata TaxID=61149 RepID=A0A2P2MQP1_RHIMU
MVPEDGLSYRSWMEWKTTVNGGYPVGNNFRNMKCREFLLQHNKILELSSLKEASEEHIQQGPLEKAQKIIIYVMKCRRLRTPHNQQSKDKIKNWKRKKKFSKRPNNRGIPSQMVHES